MIFLYPDSFFPVFSFSCSCSLMVKRLLSMEPDIRLFLLEMCQEEYQDLDIHYKCKMKQTSRFWWFWWCYPCWAFFFFFNFFFLDLARLFNSCIRILSVFLFLLIFLLYFDLDQSSHLFFFHLFLLSFNMKQ